METELGNTRTDLLFRIVLYFFVIGMYWRILDDDDFPKSLALEMRDFAVERIREFKSRKETLDAIRALPESKGVN